jgi:hypothetical protein
MYLTVLSSALCWAAACADGDDNSDGSGGSGGLAGSGGGGTQTGGTPQGGAGTGGTQAGGAGGAAGEGQAGTPGITCEPPEPPLVGAGGASGAGGAGSGAGGEAGAPLISSGLAIAGSYVDNWDGHHMISSVAWTGGGSAYHIAAFDNAERWIVAQNDQRNEFNPCLWSRFDWTEADGVLYYCLSAYNAESQAAALATPAADSSDPATKGCGALPGFPWTSLMPQ